MSSVLIGTVHTGRTYHHCEFWKRWLFREEAPRKKSGVLILREAVWGCSWKPSESQPHQAARGRRPDGESTRLMRDPSRDWGSAANSG